MNSSSIFPFVVADIGGTNARFGIATGEKDKDKRFIIEHQQVYTCTKFTKFETVFKQYLDAVHIESGHQEIKYACIAIAAPVVGDEISMTNLDWTFSIKQLCQQNNMEKIHVVNDFGALAYSTLYLQDSELKTIYSANNNYSASQSKSKAIIGPGTGLGIAGLIHSQSAWHPVCGEGGHSSFSVTDSLQFEARKALLSILKTQHISIENILSGPGLVNLYQAVCQINNEKAEALNAAQISELAAKKSNKNCIKALELFTQTLGASAGDIALTMGAFGGVYLSGGILPKIIDTMDTQLLIKHYLNKGVKQDLLKTIPVYLVSAPMPALTGAAHLMFDLHG